MVIFPLFCFSQTSPSSKLEYWVYLDNKHNMVNCPITRITPPVSPVPNRPCPCLPISSPVTASVESSLGNPMASPTTDTYSPSSSTCGPTGSAWSPGGFEQDPVSAAAHLHLLGESLSLIGHHLQRTDVSTSTSFPFH